MFEQLDMFKAPGPPPVPHIPFDEARQLSGADAYRILCGAPRELVLAERRAWLAEQLVARVTRPPRPALPGREPVATKAIPEPIPTVSTVQPLGQFVLAKHTYVNLCDDVLRFRSSGNEAPGGEFVVAPERSVWLRKQTFDKLSFSERECLVESQDVLSLVRRGEVRLTDRLRECLLRAGLTPPQSSVWPKRK